MKINQVEQCLTELKEEDQNRLNRSLENIKKIQVKLKEQEEDLMKKESNVDKYELLHKIKKDKLMNAYIFISLFEIPVGFIILLIPLFELMPTAIVILLMTFSVFLIADGYRNYNSIHSVIGYDKRSACSKIYQTLKELLKSKSDVKNKLIISQLAIEEANATLDELRAREISELCKIDEYRDELSYIEGCLIGIAKVIEKRIIDDIPENNEMVNYVNSRLELKMHK